VKLSTTRIKKQVDFLLELSLKNSNGELNDNVASIKDYLKERRMNTPNQVELILREGKITKSCTSQKYTLPHGVS